MAENNGIIRLDPAGVAPVLSYNVPEPTSYSAVGVIELSIPTDWYLDSEEGYAVRTPVNEQEVVEAMRAGFHDLGLFPRLGVPGGTFKWIIPSDGVLDDRHLNDVDKHYYHGLLIPGLSPLQSLQSFFTPIAWLTSREIFENILLGKRLQFSRTMDNRWRHEFVPVTASKPTLALVEHYRLSSFLGKYGAGRTLKTFSLLPGEKTTIRIKTYKKEATRSKEAQSILDSYSSSSAESFEEALKQEKEARDTSSTNHNWSISAKGGVNTGVYKVDVSASYSGAANASREHSARNLSDALRKSASTASNKRDITISQENETTTEEGEEMGTERAIQNINVGSTLNFVFRQMNQEFISLLHLVDVKLAYNNASLNAPIVVDLSEMDSLLSRFLEDRGVSTSEGGEVKPIRERVKEMILGELENVYDFKDTHHSFVERRERRAADGRLLGAYHRVRKNLTSQYEGITVPGIILTADSNVLRTDGIIVEALLGQGDGLDSYSHGLQNEAVREKRLAGDMLLAKLARERLLQKILQDGDLARAELWATAYTKPEPPHPPTGTGTPTTG